MILYVLIFLFVLVVKFFLSFFYFFFLFEVFLGLSFLYYFELWFVFDFDFHDERCVVHPFLFLYVNDFEELLNCERI